MHLSLVLPILKPFKRLYIFINMCDINKLRFMIHLVFAPPHHYALGHGSWKFGAKQPQGAN